MKQSYLQKASAKLRQKAEVLVNRPDFQTDIAILRKKWNMPQEGLVGDKKSELWQRWLDASTDAYYDNEWPKYRNELSNLKQTGKYLEFEKRQKEINDQAPLNAFRIDIENMVIKYQLSPRWENSIERYLMFNDVKYMQLPVGIWIKKDFTAKRGYERLTLEIDADTTLDEVKAEWKWIKFHQKRLSYKTQQKFQPIKKLPRDRRAYELERQGKTLDEIGQILYEEFGEDMDYSHIALAINRYKKRLHIN